MKYTRNLIFVLIAGLIIFLLGVLAPIIYINYYTSNFGAIGIIGGTDGPSYIFWLSSLFNGLPLLFVVLGACLTVTSCFCLVFSKAVKAYCSLKTSTIALALSATGGLGAVSVLKWYFIVSFGEVSKHPILHPACVLLGGISFLAVVFLTVLYFSARKKNWSVKGFVIDFLTVVVFLPTFGAVFSYLYEIIGPI